MWIDNVFTHFFFYCFINNTNQNFYFLPLLPLPSQARADSALGIVYQMSKFSKKEQLYSEQWDQNL